jgi:type IV pilus assembly protein PilW
MSGRARAQLGYTLIELLIAVTIGLLLTVLVSQVFVGSRRAYATTDDLSRMQENMRYTHDLLGRSVRMASYMSSPSNVPVGFDSYTGQFDGASAAVIGADGTSNNPDKITLQYQGTADGATIDCLGAVVPENTVATNILTVETVNAVPSLTCRKAAADNPTVLVTDIDNMQILYGEEINGDFNADRYVPAASVSDMNRVVSVRIALLFRTQSQGMRGANNPDTTQYDLLGKTLPAFSDAEATRIRRVMTVTFTLRNRSP